MTPAELAQSRARARGHDIEVDPPFMSAADRWTCRNCGRAAIANGNVIYGAATTENCSAKESRP